jgi:hypothetical protein
MQAFLSIIEEETMSEPSLPLVSLPGLEAYQVQLAEAEANPSLTMNSLPSSSASSSSASSSSGSSSSSNSSLGQDVLQGNSHHFWNDNF